MTRRDLIRELMNTELTEHKKLTRNQARTVTREFFESIADALNEGEEVELPFGWFWVDTYQHKPRRFWDRKNKRFRILYKRKNQIKFRGQEYDSEPPTEGRTDRPR